LIFERLEPAIDCSGADSRTRCRGNRHRGVLARRARGEKLAADLRRVAGLLPRRAPQPGRARDPQRGRNSERSRWRPGDC